MLSIFKSYPIFQYGRLCSHSCGFNGLYSASLNQTIQFGAVSSQFRGFRKFSRNPIRVNPAKGDEQKKHMKDYVELTKATVNHEVLEEIKSLKQKSSARLNFSPNNTSFETVANKLQKPNFKPNKNDKHRDEETNYEVIEDMTYENECSKSQESKESLNVLKQINVKLLHKAPGSFRTLLKQCRTSKSRNEHNLLMLDTPILIQEALSAGLIPNAIYFSRVSSLIKMMPKRMNTEECLDRLKSYPLFRTLYKDISLCSSLTTSPGIIGVFTLCTAEDSYVRANEMAQLKQNSSLPCTLLLDSVKEPGNLGAILRTAAASGVNKVILTKGCCNPWESKALRAASGAHFSLNILTNVEWDAIYNFVAEQPTVYIADICNNDRQKISLKDREIDDDDDIKNDDAIEIEKQLRLHHELKEEEFFHKKSQVLHASEIGSKSDIYISREEEKGDTELLYDESFNDNQVLDKYKNVLLPSKNYTEIKFFPNVSSKSDNEIVMIIGSEIGLSNSSKKFAVDNYGQQISVPLNNNVESLNTSVASGIILYEILNQYKIVKEVMSSDDKNDVKEA